MEFWLLQELVNFVIVYSIHKRLYVADKAMGDVFKLPDRPFHNFRAPKSGDPLIFSFQESRTINFDAQNLW